MEAKSWHASYTDLMESLTWSGSYVECQQRFGALCVQPAPVQRQGSDFLALSVEESDGGFRRRRHIRTGDGTDDGWGHRWEAWNEQNGRKWKSVIVFNLLDFNDGYETTWVKRTQNNKLNIQPFLIKPLKMSGFFFLRKGSLNHCRSKS